MKILILLIIIFTINLTFAQTSKNMQLLDQNYLADIYPTWPSDARFNCAWGYIEPVSGDKYFYVGNTKGMTIFNVNDPEDIDSVGTVLSSPGITHIKDYKDYLYTTPGAIKNDVLIFNVSDQVGAYGPENPELVGSIPVGGTNDSIKKVHDLYIEDDVLYLACLDNAADSANTNSPQLFMYDVSDPDDPDSIGSWIIPRYVPHKHNYGTYTEDFNYWVPSIGEVWVKDNRIYCAAGASGVIVATFKDSTDNEENLCRYIVEDSTWVITYTMLRDTTYEPDSTFTEYMLAHTVKATDDHKYIFVCDENLPPKLFAPKPTPKNQGAILRLFDISDIKTFKPISEEPPYEYLEPIQRYDVHEDSGNGRILSSNENLLFPSEPPNSIHKVFLNNNFAYISYYTKSVRILDISDIENWKEVAYYDTPDSAVTTPSWDWFKGSFSVYPYFGNDHILAPDCDDVISLSFGEMGTISSSTTWSGTKYITADLEVSQGDTLTISEGSEIKFSEDAKLTVRGTLLINGTSSEPVTINSMKNDEQGYGIYAVDNPEPMGTEVDINYCTIENLSVGLETNRAEVEITNSTIKNCGTGISLLNGMNLDQTVEDDSITNCNYGIYIDNAEPIVTDNVITDCKNNAIVVESSEGEFSGNIIEQDGNSEAQYLGAFYATDGSAPFLQFEAGDALNDISSGKGFGMRADDYTTIYAGDEETDGGNEISDNYTYEAEAHDNSTIYAVNNFWGTDEVDEQQFNTSGSSNIYYDPWLEESPLKGLEKSISLKENSIASEEGSWKPLFLTYYKSNNHSSLKTLGKSLLQSSLLSQQNMTMVLGLLNFSSLSNNDSSIINFINTFRNSTSNSDIKTQSLMYLVNNYLTYGEFEKLKKIIIHIKTEYKGTKLEAYALFKEIQIELYNNHNRNAALSVYKTLNSNYPKSKYINFAQILLKISISSINKNSSNLLSDDSNLPLKYALLPNYPNPFNPSTSIAFTIPKFSEIEIKIYDLLGRKVKTLFQKRFKRGLHTEVWDGKNQWGKQVASGMYFYTFKAKSLDGSKETFTKSSKLLLLR